MHPNSNLSDMLANCHVQSDGFVSTVAAQWRLGTVLFARNSMTFAAVRKAPIKGANYEFEGMYSLPGGMVRAPADGDRDQVEDVLRASLRDRAHREASLSLVAMSEPRSWNLGPLMTSYTAKNRQRFTLIVPYMIDIRTGIEATVHLEAADHSVDEAFWAAIPPNWKRMAPANRLAVAHLVWGMLAEEDRAAARPAVAQALHQCSDWAVEVQVARAAAPWASEDELSAWRNAWPI